MTAVSLIFKWSGANWASANEDMAEIVRKPRTAMIANVRWNDVNHLITYLCLIARCQMTAAYVMVGSTILW